MAAKRKKKSNRTIRLRFRKNDPGHNLLAAVQHFIIANGGSAALIGGVEIQHWPGDFAGKYKIAVGALGIAPSPKKDQSQ